MSIVRIVPLIAADVKSQSALAAAVNARIAKKCCVATVLVNANSVKSCFAKHV